ncbi:phosphoribosylglycinamide formyltransferase [Psychrosphaera ytuae]|uniref:Phosphoribosylglycinamide formyltransferase n=1 Tax=Psychrosphaera ytuae TaxID=2820710 RepID=A0A975HJ00_9GAMM|nr:phosphoribosylglycinamide formyltransferase [Psychrosphaera ytuae]QTH64708.1 phosphoribosylglycinamide formyltransferase [Psychrosphaera ytuae]
MAKIVVLISGNGSNLQAIIDSTETGKIAGDVVAVISNKSSAFGLQRASNHNIATHIVDHTQYDSRESYDAELANTIEQYKPDVVVLAGFMRILTAGFVDQFTGRLINIHPSLLPKYQGLNTHQRAIDAGDTEHGCSVHYVNEQLDGGPVILQAKVPVFEDDTADTLAERVHVQEHMIYPLVVKWLCEKRLRLQSDGVYLDDLLLPEQGYANDD